MDTFTIQVNFSYRPFINIIYKDCHNPIRMGKMKTNAAPFKICMLLEQFHPHVGGVQVHSRYLAEQLIESGIRVFVVTRQVTAQLSKSESVGGIPVYRIPPKGLGCFKRWLMIIPSLALLIKMRKQYDIIYVPFFRILGIPAVLVSKIFHKACVLRAGGQGELSGEIFNQGLKELKLRHSSLTVKSFLRIRNWLIKKADRFVSISSDITLEYISNGVDCRKIKYIPHGVDTGRFHPVSYEEKLNLRHKLGLPASKTIVAFVGRLVSTKGLPLLIRVWKDIVSIHSDAYLVLVGSGDYGAYNYESELRDFVQTQALDGSVYFAGKVENVQRYFQASDIFVLPSETEGFGIALIEAMACGLPVVVTPTSGPKDIVKNGENGIHITNFQELYIALDSLLMNRFLADSLGQAARKTILERYELKKMVNEYTELFSSLNNSYIQGKRVKTI
jgi:glycosyltransferase involved in cell wall biosynthesis